MLGYAASAVSEPTDPNPLLDRAAPPSRKLRAGRPPATETAPLDPADLRGASLDLHVVRLCSVFEPPHIALHGRAAQFDPIGGMQNHCAQLTRALDRLGVRQTVITTRPPDAPRVDRLGRHTEIRRHGLPIPHLRQLYAVCGGPDLLRAARGADLVHVHQGEDLAAIPLGMAVARAWGIPLVITVHCSLRHTFVTGGDLRSALLARAGSAVELAGTRAARAVIALTPRLAGLLAEEGVDPGRLHVIPSGVRPAEFADVPADPWPDLEGRRVVFVGRLARQKGVRTLVEAAARLRTPGARVVLVGDGPERNAVEAAVAMHGLEDRVRLTGFRPHEEVPGILAHADVMVLPSVYEELGSVLLEGMQAGVPIVASDAGGIPDAVGSAAELVPPEDPTALAAAIDRVLSDPVRAAELSRLARDRARHYDWEALAGRVLDVYAGCVLPPLAAPGAADPAAAEASEPATTA